MTQRQLRLSLGPGGYRYVTFQQFIPRTWVFSRGLTFQAKFFSRFGKIFPGLVPLEYRERKQIVFTIFEKSYDCLFHVITLYSSRFMGQIREFGFCLALSLTASI